MPNILPKIRPVNLKVATLNLDDGLTHVSGRQQIVHSMTVNKIDILALQETRVNSDVTEYHGGYTFHVSTNVSFEQKTAAENIREKERESANPTLTEIELYNLDAEKQGVWIVYSKRLSAYRCNVRQINGRTMMISFDTSPLRTNVIAAYAPHAGTSKEEKRKFYKELSDVLDSIPNHETKIILGDFNVRLMEQLPHEVGVLGTHIFRDENSKVEQLSEKQQENRENFVDLCQERKFVATNAMFQKESARLMTYRNVTRPHLSAPYTTDHYAQLDFVFINQR